MLKSAILSSGRERHYDYDGTRMTRIADETGRVLLRNWYNSEVVIQQQFAKERSINMPTVGLLIALPG